MDKRAWRATVHRVSKSQTRLNDLAHLHPSLGISERWSVIAAGSSSLLGRRVSDTILPVHCQTIRSRFEDEMESPLVFTGPACRLPPFSSSHGRAAPSGVVQPTACTSSFPSPQPARLPSPEAVMPGSECWGWYQLNHDSPLSRGCRAKLFTWVRFCFFLQWK